MLEPVLYIFLEANASKALLKKNVELNRSVQELEIFSIQSCLPISTEKLVKMIKRSFYEISGTDS